MTHYYKSNSLIAFNENGNFIQVLNTGTQKTITTGADKAFCCFVVGVGAPCSREDFDAALETCVAEMTNNLEAINI